MPRSRTPTSTPSTRSLVPESSNDSSNRSKTRSSLSRSLSRAPRTNASSSRSGSNTRVSMPSSAKPTRPSNDLHRPRRPRSPHRRNRTRSHNRLSIARSLIRRSAALDHRSCRPRPISLRVTLDSPRASAGAMLASVSRRFARCVEAFETTATTVQATSCALIRSKNTIASACAPLAPTRICSNQSIMRGRSIDQQNYEPDVRSHQAQSRESWIDLRCRRVLPLFARTSPARMLEYSRLLVPNSV